VSEEIFEDIHVVRVVGWDARDTNNPAITATQIIWATIKAHTIMEEYSWRNFFEHPSISAVIARHLHSNHSHPDSTLNDRLKKVEASIVKLSTRLDSLEPRLARVEAKNDIPPPHDCKNRKTKGPGVKDLQE